MTTPASNPPSPAEVEAQRVAHLVLGRPRPKPGRNRSRKGRADVVRLAPGIEEAVQLRERWSHKAQGTPETHENHDRMSRREGSIARLHTARTIDDHQLAAAQEIVAAHEAIVADVAVRTAKLEPRGTGGGPLSASATPIAAVIRERAYGQWRESVGANAAMLLAIIVDDVPLTHAARRWRMSNRRARGILVTALDRWRRA